MGFNRQPQQRPAASPSFGGPFNQQAMQLGGAQQQPGFGHMGSGAGLAQQQSPFQTQLGGGFQPQPAAQSGGKRPAGGAGIRPSPRVLPGSQTDLAAQASQQRSTDALDLERFRQQAAQSARMGSGR